MAIIGYNHAQVTAPPGSDEAIRHFYGQVLGLSEMPVPESMRAHRLIWFRVGNLELHVGQEEGVDRNKTKAHLAFEVDDIDQWRRRLAEQGIETFNQPLIPGYDRLHLKDPFGNRVEIIGRVKA